ncbi:nucleoside-diphosphate-sugar epimerase [Rhodoligotrophos appendicifer]|uniref:SDR family oxidoreductase n=1 Tax=Rhodoligotrophos appendicifer TaxID=987056 RepID=UPI001186369E|nr:SDR family oxidoreductase [Rhodoligotrophos appendicifer]
MPRHALIAGALGIVGTTLVDHLVSLGDWTVTGLSRKAPPASPGWRHLALDLADARACREAAVHLGTVTHLFYCARYSNPDAPAEAAMNRAMLAHILEPLAASPSLEHVSLVHGTKWYGSHLGPYRTPARESDPRHAGPNFYYDQLDDVERLQRGRDWTWSTVRPHIVCAPTTGYPFNLVTLLGAYGALCAARGQPLDFPGTEACYHSISQATDARLLARAMVWAATDPVCANQSYNIINGDYFRWSNLWPRLAEFFAVPLGQVRNAPLAAIMSGADAEWQALITARNLAPHPLASLANWTFGDFLFRADWDDLSSIVKSRQHGFPDAIDTEQSILDALATLRRHTVIP